MEAIAADPALHEEALSDAVEALSRGPYSVTDKPRALADAGLHDYASIGPYWWPDPVADDGLPYVRRDGVVNPERDGPEFDKSRLRALSEDMRALALGYYLSQDERFAEHAAMLARTWFIDSATRMTPNFDFAQGIPGRVDGRGEGIIEASHLSTIVESLGLLRPSAAFGAQDERALREWYRDFLVWMATSDNGDDEMRKANNHGVFFDFYLAHFALFAGAPDVARNVVAAFPDYRLGVQMDRQGRFFAELGRTRSWHYAHYVVDGAARLATIGECVGLDLWGANLDDGRSLSTARQFLLRYAENPAGWPFPDTDLDAGRIERMRGVSREVLFLWGEDGPVDLDELP
ncbi:alginate lyase family protein [Aurantiacibacter spongiae]|uniref:alginate lyase family protein n=1 Tax=Aurantiacibacter spongiae TaxID=2488860 RepID=UPI0013158364|nr:alginate lyase family protein [Aurantiacibacter spongiae]